MALGEIDFDNPGDAEKLIDQAINMAKEEGYAAVIGPMNGDTWHSYRLVTETDQSPPFMLEPTSSPMIQSVFESRAFKIISEYASTRAPLQSAIGDKAPDIPGISVEPWDGENPRDLVKTIFDLSADSFARNRFFKPIELSGFFDIYLPLLSAIDPAHVLLAKTQTGQICGFLFGYPDPNSSQPTVVLKTYASGVRGVGFLLADTFHRRALEMGFENVIHALMHQDNISLNRSGLHNAKVFRRYALMGLKLGD